jgi:hypothetical protein
MKFPKMSMKIIVAICVIIVIVMLFLKRDRYINTPLDKNKTIRILEFLDDRYGSSNVSPADKRAYVDYLVEPNVPEPAGFRTKYQRIVEILKLPDRLPPPPLPPPPVQQPPMPRGFSCTLIN